MFEVSAGGLLDKFEEYFGRKLTRAFLILIGLTAAVVCLKFIWDYGVSPVYFAIYTIATDASLEAVWALILSIAKLLAIVLVGIFFASMFELRRNLIMLREGIDNTVDIQAEARQLQSDAGKSRDDVLGALNAAKDIMGKAKLLDEECKFIAAELKSLAKRTEATELAVEIDRIYKEASARFGRDQDGSGSASSGP